MSESETNRMRYAVGLGSNRRGRHGSPAAEIAAALAALGAAGIAVESVSSIVLTPAIGPSIRRFANAAALVATDLAPPALLARLKMIEAASGRRRGRRWGARVIDLDILLWSGGRWASRGLTIPHPAFRQRDFVLRPLATIAPGWRDPVTLRSVRVLARAVDRRRPRF